MPKLKTNRAAAKRFRKTAKGFKSYSAGRRHNPRTQGAQDQAPAAFRRLEPRSRAMSAG
ncbi:MAG: 50S ribosomal protein L35 [Sinobacteraceae bacterium]|nr:50S ribosomal protein L35 [Nevskiaceae bacterium]